MPKTVGACEHCGKSIEFYPSQKRRFCSRSCQSIVTGRSRTAPMPVKPKTGRYQACERCGTEFWVIKSDEGRRRFCSRDCKDANHGRNAVTKTCAVCKVEFTVSPSQAVWRNTERVYCSRECMGLGHIKRSLGRTHNGKPAVVDSSGYVRVFEPAHPNSFKSGWVLEHRLVVEERLGRRLRTDEHVHHINHVRTDNRPENLTVLSHSEHSTITARENTEALKAALEARQTLLEYERRFGPLNI